MYKLLIGAAFATLGIFPAQAQDYPTKPVSMIAPFPPGGGPAAAALLGGQVHALASGPGPVAGQIKAGRMRALAGWGDKRLAMMPELPTFKEIGYKDVEFYIWSGVFAPAATPAPVQAKLRDAVRAAAADPAFKGAMDKAQTPVVYLDAPQFRDFLAKDAARLKVAVEKIGKIADK